MAILDGAIQQNRIHTSITNNKSSYREFDNKEMCIEDDCETNATQTDQLPLTNFVTEDHLDRARGDFVEFKQFSYGKFYQQMLKFGVEA